VAGSEFHRGRYLWLKLTLSSFDEARRPSVRELQVFHPRTSYLRYLPATYQEVPGDPSSRNISSDFLERFLSLFEAFFWSLDVEINQIFEYFDPDKTPAEFLAWLARWLNVGLEEEWDANRKRRLLNRAWELYENKGTRSGLASLIDVVAGWRVQILEDARLLEPIPLGGKWHLGRNTFVRCNPERGFRLGDSSLLGSVAIRREPQGTTDPFLVAAHRFTVLVFGDPDKVRRDEQHIRNLIDENKPAHTVYTLRVVGEGAMGGELRVGINTRLVGGAPLRLGENTTLGRAVAVSRTRPATRLGSSSRLGRGFELT
jgi:phage tail-like protein